MITAQDIREKTFEKATFGGYDMGEVDDFLEEMAADIAASQKEVGVLRGKMKVLVDKIEEYRATEEAMRMALVSAQKVAKEIEGDARAKADALLAEAQAKADEVLSEAQATADSVTGDLQAKREAEENRLESAQNAAAAYIEKMLLVCQKQTDFLTALKDMEMTGGPVVTPAPAEKRAIAPAFEDEPETPAPQVDEAVMEGYYKDFESAVYTPEAEEPQTPADDTFDPDEDEDGDDPEDEEIDEPTRLFRF